MLTVVDSFTRDCPAIEVDTGLSSRQVARVVEWIVSQRGRPGVHQSSLSGLVRGARYSVDPRSARTAYAERHVESFNGRFRDECLKHHWFITLADAKEKIERWNAEQPHSSFVCRTPDEYAEICSKLTNRLELLPSRLVAAR